MLGVSVKNHCLKRLLKTSAIIKQFPELNFKEAKQIILVDYRAVEILKRILNSKLVEDKNGRTQRTNNCNVIGLVSKQGTRLQ